MKSVRLIFNFRMALVHCGPYVPVLCGVLRHDMETLFVLL